jgi:hypothetical protein
MPTPASGIRRQAEPAMRSTLRIFWIADDRLGRAIFPRNRYALGQIAGLGYRKNSSKEAISAVGRPDWHVLCSD